MCARRATPDGRGFFSYEQIGSASARLRPRGWMRFARLFVIPRASRVGFLSVTRHCDGRASPLPVISANGRGFCCLDISARAETLASRSSFPRRRESSALALCWSLFGLGFWSEGFRSPCGRATYFWHDGMPCASRLNRGRLPVRPCTDSRRASIHAHAPAGIFRLSLRCSAPRKARGYFVARPSLDYVVMDWAVR